MPRAPSPSDAYAAMHYKYIHGRTFQQARHTAKAHYTTSNPPPHDIGILPPREGRVVNGHLMTIYGGAYDVRSSQDPRWTQKNIYTPIFPLVNKASVLPLSHKSGELCWERPLTVSDVFGDNFFEILSVFWVETHFFFVVAHYPAWASG